MTASATEEADGVVTNAAEMQAIVAEAGDLAEEAASKKALKQAKSICTTRGRRCRPIVIKKVVTRSRAVLTTRDGVLRVPVDAQGDPNHTQVSVTATVQISGSCYYHASVGLL